MWKGRSGAAGAIFVDWWHIGLLAAACMIRASNFLCLFGLDHDTKCFLIARCMTITAADSAVVVVAAAFFQAANVVSVTDYTDRVTES